jgi:hypothetical protein
VETLIRADIFFFISSVFVIVLTVGCVLALFYIIPTLKNIRHISSVAKEEGDKLADDIDGLRTTVKEKGAKVKSFFDYFLTFFTGRKKNKLKKDGS